MSTREAAPPLPAERPAPETVASYDAVTGDVLRVFPAATPENVRAAVARARTAHAVWRAVSIADRARAIERFRATLYERRDEVATTIARETGKPVVEALAAEVAVVLEFARYYAREAPRRLAMRWARPTSLAWWRKRLRTEHESYGVVGVISPWNYPFMLAAGIVLPALAAGNTVVLKPSDFTPASGEILGDLLRAAGLPPSVCEVVQGAGATGAALTQADVDKVFFTGSVPTGRRVAAACAERLVPCVLELGGSDAAIVLDDADVSHAASGLTWGRFSNAGQTCVAPKRVYVSDRIYDQFVAAVSERVAQLHVGADADVGPVIRGSQQRAVQEQLDDAVSGGARVIGNRDSGIGNREPATSFGGAFFPPTIIDGVRPSARALREEVFGPVMVLVRVRDADEAIALANESVFGLSASVWSNDRERAVAVADRIDAGTVTINDVAVSAGMADVPHGGVKQSGTGRSHGIDGLMECVRTKTLVDDRFVRWRQPWWFGYTDQAKADFEAFLTFAHGRGAFARLRAIAGTVRLVMRAKRPV
jgi:acyl-CoA reductase-like NAD-dependent aldehyde dehydrogenase